MALFEGGMRSLEVTLRTPAALEVISRMRAAVPKAIVGAGTILTPQDMDAACKAGALFGVTPGTTPCLLASAKEFNLPVLPGVATPSEAMLVRESGYEIMKLFPAEASGGVPLLKSWAAPLSGIAFCPTGGITFETAKSYLELSNVICIGGSWMATKMLIKNKQWKEITKLAKQALDIV